MWEKYLCWKAGLQKSLYKRRGLPATPDVGTLATLFKSLRLAVDDKLGKGSCKHAPFAMFPELPGLTYEDFLDAVEYAGLERVESSYGQDYISEISAASGAMGYSICRNYTYAYDCLREESHMWRTQKLYLSYTNMSLTAVNTFYDVACLISKTSRQVRFDLGRSSLPTNGDEDMQHMYWWRIRDAIVQVGLEELGLPTALFLVGEYADDPLFLKTVNEALRDIFPRDKSDTNGLKLGAMGAAEFAKRSLEIQKFCWEPPECDENRRPPLPVPVDRDPGEQAVLKEER
ncbi:hypothetical protein AJ79_04920 [Helicocarpus griseus UAMH5409]|uniref:Uncharacterized protein n=1 Tax=Helicocarpus griseus UAMH5409 TaxID=1447875 RepID=A0A2B7XR44_9EURO|nr:hypothetical protein AJ79_04920 [Helicocarpus griseus UAMH5409]